jgi:hypothetical protein
MSVVRCRLLARSRHKLRPLFSRYGLESGLHWLVMNFRF